MKLILESTSTIGTIVIDGVQVPVRVWEGTTERGTKCFAYITGITPALDAERAEFEVELQHCDHDTIGVSDPNLPLILFIG